MVISFLPLETAVMPGVSKKIVSHSMTHFRAVSVMISLVIPTDTREAVACSKSGSECCGQQKQNAVTRKWIDEISSF